MKSTKHFLLQFPLYISARKRLIVKIRDVEVSLPNENENCFCHILQFGSHKLNGVKNLCILNATIEYILSTERFNVLFKYWKSITIPKAVGNIPSAKSYLFVCVQFVCFFMFS